MPTEKEYQIMRRAALYELRILLTSGQKKEYTVDELVELLDKIAMEDDVFCETLYQDYLKDPDRGDFVPFEDALKECGVSLEEMI